MKIEKVTYQKTFPTGPYLNEKIGIEISVDSHEEAAAAFKLAVLTVDAWHKDANPHLYQEEKYPQPYPNPERFTHMTSGQLQPTEVTYGPPPVIQKEKEDVVLLKQQILAEISLCPTMPDLAQYKLLSANDPKLYEAYTARLKELTNV